MFSLCNHHSNCNYIRLSATFKDDLPKNTSPRASLKEDIMKPHSN